MMPVKESHVDVLVIGAGPAGLMCAQGLARAGVDVRIIDKRPDRVAAGHADGIQPRTIEVLQSYGFAERLLREANQMHMAAFYGPSPQEGGIERTGRVPEVNAPTARYPFQVTLHQGAIEAIFVDYLRSIGTEVHRPVIPESIELSKDPTQLKDPQSHPLKVVLRHLKVSGSQSDVEIVHAKYVVGADGAHSWVRRTCGISMDGEQTDDVWGVMDVLLDTNFPDIRFRSVIHSNNGSIMVIPREGDITRLYIQLTPQDVKNATTNGRVDSSKYSADKLLEVARKSLYPYKMKVVGNIIWWTLYVIGQRVASTFSVHERLFIAGDACHTHSPKAGQGMNASMNDTHNLVWKLTHVLRGWADISLLKTYEFERRQYAQELIDFDRTFAALFSGKPRTDDNPDGVSQEEFLKAFRTLSGFITGVGIHYADSCIVKVKYQSCANKLIVGERVLPQIIIRAADARPYDMQDMLPADTRFKILIFTGDINNPYQLRRVEKLAQQMDRPGSFLRKYAPSGAGLHAVFDILTITSTKKEDVTYTSVPELLRSHWSKVFLDDVDTRGNIGGQAYKAYGIDCQGAIVLVRPDQYVGMVAPFEKLQDIDDYFAGFISIPSPNEFRIVTHHRSKL